MRFDIANVRVHISNILEIKVAPFSINLFLHILPTVFSSRLSRRKVKLRKWNGKFCFSQLREISWFFLLYLMFVSYCNCVFFSHPTRIVY